MKLVGIYLKEHIPALVLLAFFSGVFALVFALYGLPVQAVAYPALICLFLGAVAAAARFARWKRRHTLLQMLRSEISETVEGLPAAGCCLEADYQALLQALHREKTDLAGRMEQEFLCSCIGTRQQVLFEQDSGGVCTGHAGNYAAVSVSGEGLHNAIKTVQITGQKDGKLWGNVVL